MKDMKKLCEVIEQELHKIAEKGLTTSNVDTAYKLVDMYKDLKNTDYWETKGEYYMAVLDEMQGGYSEGNYPMMEDGYAMRGRKRDRMGRYSREDGMMNDNMSYARGCRGGNRGYSNNEGMMHERYMDAKQSYRSNKSMCIKIKLHTSCAGTRTYLSPRTKARHLLIGIFIKTENSLVLLNSDATYRKFCDLVI